MFLIGVSIVFFIWMWINWLEFVLIYLNVVVIFYGKLVFEDLGNVKIMLDQQNSFFLNFSQKSICIFVIIEKDGKIYVLFEEDYLVEDIFRVLCSVVKEWKEGIKLIFFVG